MSDEANVEPLPFDQTFRVGDIITADDGLPQFCEDASGYLFRVRDTPPGKRFRVVAVSADRIEVEEAPQP